MPQACPSICPHQVSRKTRCGLAHGHLPTPRFHRWPQGPSLPSAVPLPRPLQSCDSMVKGLENVAGCPTRPSPGLGLARVPAQRTTAGGGGRGASAWSHPCLGLPKSPAVHPGGQAGRARPRPQPVLPRALLTEPSPLAPRALSRPPREDRCSWGQSTLHCEGIISTPVTPTGVPTQDWGPRAPTRFLSQGPGESPGCSLPLGAPRWQGPSGSSVLRRAACRDQGSSCPPFLWLTGGHRSAICPLLLRKRLATGPGSGGQRRAWSASAAAHLHTAVLTSLPRCPTVPQEAGSSS